MRKPLEYYMDKSIREKKQAYMLINLGNGKFERLHRLVWICSNGEIPKGYEINHKNKLRWDNRLENLELLTHSDHSKLHLRERKGEKRSKEACNRMSIAHRKWLALPGEMKKARERFKKAQSMRWVKNGTS